MSDDIMPGPSPKQRGVEVILAHLPSLMFEDATDYRVTQRGHLRVVHTRQRRRWWGTAASEVAWDFALIHRKHWIGVIDHNSRTEETS